MPDRWTACLDLSSRCRTQHGAIAIGILPGEGVGPEVTQCALQILRTVTESAGVATDVCEGGLIGRDAEQTCGIPLSDEVVRFCEGVFARGGAVLHGPGGGRFVYDLRKQFDLFLKISPLQSAMAAPDAGRLKPEAAHGVDMLITRENTGGLYQGSWHEGNGAPGKRWAEHHARYSEQQVRRFLRASARLAKNRRGELTVVWKESGVPTISRLWRDCAYDAADEFGVQARMVDIDLMAYRLIQEAQAFDVVAAPNLFGDVLADLGAVLLGSRGASFSGNFSPTGDAVYQTNHGAAYDLAGLDRANPVGHILALAMMLRETFSLEREARAIELAVRSIWGEGCRTEDLAAPGAQVVGMREMGERIARRAVQILDDGQRSGSP